MSKLFELQNVSVVIPTRNRPEYLSALLRSIESMSKQPVEIVVVDSSDNSSSQLICSNLDNPLIMYLRFPGGKGNQTRARNCGFMSTTSPVIAFLDDDTTLSPNWLEEVQKGFADKSIQGACGRVINKGDLEPSTNLEIQNIGRITSTGHLTGNFHLDSGKVIDIDHGIGANMIFRREVIHQLKGFRDDFKGTLLREETDFFIRLRNLGYRIVFLPNAIAYEHAAPHEIGSRFDSRYNFWAAHNHVLLLARNYGFLSRILWRWIRSEVFSVSYKGGSILRQAFRVLRQVTAIFVGFGYSIQSRQNNSGGLQEPPEL